MPEEPRRTICLDQFLKFMGVADTGGFAKRLIQENQVRVNEQPETRRRRKLVAGDVVEVEGQRIVVEFPPEEET